MSRTGSYPAIPSQRYLAVGFAGRAVPDLQKDVTVGILSSMVQHGVVFDDPVRGTAAAVIGAVTAVREHLVERLQTSHLYTDQVTATQSWLTETLAIDTDVPVEAHPGTVTPGTGVLPGTDPVVPPRCVLSTCRKLLVRRDGKYGYDGLFCTMTHGYQHGLTHARAGR